MRWQLPVSLRVALFTVFLPSFLRLHELQFADARVAQLFNGQQFSQGLIIIDSPSQNSQFTAPSSLDISIDVSGNGKVSRNSATTRLTFLEIYLVSATFNINATVSGPGNELLDGESGSTVKHVSYDVAQCLASGAYNLTFYEAGVSSNRPYFTITAIPLTIKSDASSGSSVDFSCVSPAVTTAQSQPQIDNALVESPFLTNTVVAGANGVTETTDSSSSASAKETSSSPSSTTSSIRSTVTFTQTRPTTSDTSGSSSAFTGSVAYSSSTDTTSTATASGASASTTSTGAGTGTGADTGSGGDNGTGTGTGNGTYGGSGSGSGDNPQVPIASMIAQAGGLLIPVLGESDSDSAPTNALGRSFIFYVSLVAVMAVVVL